jgi:hypothetical protein
MPRAVVVLAALAAALALAACRDERIEELDEIRAELCACKTVACGEQALRRVPQEGAPSDHRAQKIARLMMECLKQLYLSERPSTDPDAEAPDPGAAAPGAADP